MVSDAEVIYKSVDDEGKVTYSDRPLRPGQPLEKVSLPKLNIALPPRRSLSAVATSKLEQTPQDNAKYYKIRLVFPTDDEILPPVKPVFIAQVAVTPALPHNFRVSFVVDGKTYGPVADTRLRIASRRKGTRTIRAQLHNPAGRVVTQSDLVTFHTRISHIRQNRALPRRKKLPASPISASPTKVNNTGVR